MDVDLSRIRRPNGRYGWGWVDRRIVTQGHLAALTQTEVVVYLFLCVVADRQGVSWYSCRAVGQLIKHSPEQVREALQCLVRRNLVAVAGRFVQVLDLDLDVTVPRGADPSRLPVEGTTSPPAESCTGPTPGSERFAQVTPERREELVHRARQRMARFLGGREPSPSVLEAVAAGLLLEDEGDGSAR